MKQKEVKIIGLKVNERLGILQGFDLKFNQENHLIAIKGEVGSGKSTLQRSIKIGTLGSDALKDDKMLYGKIDQEVQLLDGEHKIFVGCKTDEEGKLKYILYSKDEEGNIIKDPVVDGVKLTPKNYLKELQTALTWRMNELTSENATTQKKILLELYKSELAGLRVIFDKKHKDYTTSILGKIEFAESERATNDVLRKKVGGFAKHLLTQGYDVNKADTLPNRVDISQMDKDKNLLIFEIDQKAKGLSDQKELKLTELKNKSTEVTLKLKELNLDIRRANDASRKKFEEDLTQFEDLSKMRNQVSDGLKSLMSKWCLSPESELLREFEAELKIVSPLRPFMNPEIPFDENGKCTSKTWDEEGPIADRVKILQDLRVQYAEVFATEASTDTTELEGKLSSVVSQLGAAKETNAICDAIETFKAWSESDSVVQRLKNEYAEKLSSIDTGVEGLRITVDKKDEKLDVFLSYDASFDPEYFGNPEKEFRKLSSYSGTQKPVICLLLQDYLLSKKPKALRYLWIDDVPVDNKTKALLNRMGSGLGVTIFVNITGDFNRQELKSGEILIEGGQIFFE